MSLDPRRERSSSKRKGRDGPEESTAPRKKHHRKPSTSDNEDAEQPQFADPGSDVEQPSKARKFKGKSTTRDEKEYPSVNELKKRIRDVKRLLNKKDLSADARIVQERALAGYEEDLAGEMARRERSQMISRYHFVRFLDRKTANKELKSLQRREKDDKLDSRQKKSLQGKIHAAQVNLNYTIYYPLTEKYISLYPKKSKGKSPGDGDADSGSESDTQDKKGREAGEKPALWAIVEKCMKDNTLGQLREGKMNIGPDGKPVTAPTAAPVKKTAPSGENKKTKSKKPIEQKEEAEPVYASRRERRAEKRDQYGQRQHQRAQGKGHHVAAPQDGDESDGGFFE